MSNTGYYYCSCLLVGRTTARSGSNVKDGVIENTSSKKLVQFT